LEALPEVLAKFPQAHLHLVGSGAAEDSLRQQAVDLNINESITWHGWLNLEELLLYYSAADVMVFPGTSGGTPRVMLQAMACGAPFVGAAIGGIVDHITSERGWLVPPRDTEALSTAIIEVFSDPALARKKAAQGKAYAQTLSWSKVAERVLNEVYCPLAADRGNL
jgi:glycosyltransferase involved in cell wall biosynthesis